MKSPFSISPRMRPRASVILAASSFDNMPVSPSIATWASEPAMSCAASFWSKSIEAMVAFACSSAPCAFYLVRWGRPAFADASASSFGGMANNFDVPTLPFLGKVIRESPGLVFSFLLIVSALIYLVIKKAHDPLVVQNFQSNVPFGAGGLTASLGGSISGGDLNFPTSFRSEIECSRLRRLTYFRLLW